VGFESWAERGDDAGLRPADHRVLLAAVLAALAGSKRERRHAPDFFARRVDGAGVVIDVRPDDLVDPAAAESFAAIAAACAEVGWEFRRTGGPSPARAANGCWLAFIM
jgi:hypothetical protein